MNPELDPTERRFERIEAALETMAKGMATLTTESHSAFAHLNSSQQHRMEEIKRILTRMDAQENDVRALFKASEAFGKGLLLMVEEVRKIAIAQVQLAEAQVKSEEAQAGTQGKLNVLIHMWDDWIKDRGRPNGGPKPEEPNPA